MKPIISKAVFLFRSSMRPALGRRAMPAVSLYRGFSTNNNGDGPKQYQNVFTQPSADKEDQQMDRATANQMFEELKDTEEEKVDSRESTTKNLSLSLL